MTLKELCKALSISEATGKNWLRLGKISPDTMHNGKASFSKKYVDSLIDDIASGKIQALNSRRNKKYVSGSFFYNSYVPKDSDCLPKVRAISEYLEENKVSLSKEEVCYLLAYYARQLFESNGNHSGICNLFDDSSDDFGIDNLFENSSDDSLDNNYLINDTCKTGIVTLIRDLSNSHLEIKLQASFKKGIEPTSSSFKSSILKMKDRHPELFAHTFIYEPGTDTLGLIYMSLRDLGSRKNAGSYYTPTEIVRKSIDNLDIDKAPVKKNSRINVLDPCCGSGNFLIQMPDTLNAGNINGCDIDPICVCITRINLALRYGASSIPVIRKNIRCANFLKTELTDIFDDPSFSPSYIIGNPPWGYDFSDEEKELFRNEYTTAKGRSVESYDLFTEKGISCLDNGGHLSFVLPEAALSVSIHKPLRKIIISSCNITYLAYLGNVFHKVACPSVILQLTKTAQKLDTRNMVVENLITPSRPSNSTINTNRKVSADKLSFYTSDEEYSILETMSSLKESAYLKGNAVFALGIVTGNNDKYIIDKSELKNEHSSIGEQDINKYIENKSLNSILYSSQNHKESSYNRSHDIQDNSLVQSNYEIVLKGSDISKYHISKPDRFIDFKPESFQQVAKTEIYRAKEKLFYRFINNELTFAYDNEGLVSLNSCNILIPQIPGLDIKYVMAILNSTPAQFYFKKSFNSVKVLRSHLEQIPIPIASDDEQREIIDMVDTLISIAQSLSETNPEISSSDIMFLPIYRKLDLKIASAYGLTDSQYKLIHDKIL